MKGSAILNFGSIGAGSNVARTVALAGATQVGAAYASPQLSLGNGNLHWVATISASNQITVTVLNHTGGAITPNTVKWNLACIV